MAFRQIVPITAPILGRPSLPVDLAAGVSDEIKALAQDLLDTSRECDGAGMAAVQVGIPIRLFVMDLAQVAGETQAYINPEIVWRSVETVTRKEGCLSMPGAMLDIERPAVIRLAYTDLDGQLQTCEAEGFAAQCIQHEMDHLDGVRMYDHVSSLKKAMTIKQFNKSRVRGRQPG